MKYYYDGITPYEEYPLDMDIECYNCKYKFDCFSDNVKSNTAKTHRCLIECLERESIDDR